MKETARLHSSYNPAGEAQRYIDSLALKKETEIYILIEPGMGYITACLRKEKPDARIIALHAGTTPAALLPENEPDVMWAADNKTGLREFLEQQIPDIEAEKIKIIEWRPGLAVYGAQYRNILSETAEFVKQADANARTQNRFGRKWFRNFFRNLLSPARQRLLSLSLCRDFFCCN